MAVQVVEFGFRCYSAYSSSGGRSRQAVLRVVVLQLRSAYNSDATSKLAMQVGETHTGRDVVELSKGGQGLTWVGGWSDQLWRCQWKLGAAANGPLRGDF